MKKTISSENHNTFNKEIAQKYFEIKYNTNLLNETVGLLLNLLRLHRKKQKCKDCFFAKYRHHNSSATCSVWKIVCIKNNQVFTGQSKVTAGFWNLFLSNTSDLYASNLLCDTTQMFWHLFSSFNPAHINRGYFLCVLYIWEA